MIDLHTHSTASDGTYDPADLVRHAARSGVSVLALTDHDTVQGLPQASAAALEAGITFVPGIEISVYWPTGEFHLLGLGLRSVSPSLAQLIAFLEKARYARNQQMASRLRAAGVDITLSQVEERFGAKNIGRPHFAALMQERGYVQTRQEAFSRYFANGRPCYVEREGAPLDDAVEAICSSGGVPVQAHPLSMYVSWGKMEETIRLIRDRGVQGLEAWHPGARLSEAERLEELAHRLGMFVTAGSDFHGETVRADRHLGRTSGGLSIQDRFYTQELLPHLGLPG